MQIDANIKRDDEKIILTVLERIGSCGELFISSNVDVKCMRTQSKMS